MKPGIPKLGLVILLVVSLLVVCRAWQTHDYNLDYFDLGLLFLGDRSGKVVSIDVISPPVEKRQYVQDQLDAKTIVPGIGVANIKFWASSEDVRTKWGSPDREHAYRMDYLKSKGISTGLSNGKVGSFHILTSDLRTPEGIGVGSTISEVQMTYGRTNSDFRVYRNWQKSLFIITRSLLLGLLVGAAVNFSLTRTSQSTRVRSIILCCISGYFAYFTASIMFMLAVWGNWPWIASCLAGTGKYFSWIWKGAQTMPAWQYYVSWLLKLTPISSVKGALLGLSLGFACRAGDSKSDSVPWKRMFSMITLGLVPFIIFHVFAYALWLKGAGMLAFRQPLEQLTELLAGVFGFRYQWENLFLLVIVASLSLLQFQGCRIWPTPKLSWSAVMFGRCPAQEEQERKDPDAQ